jgi:hypothetical protein
VLRLNDIVEVKFSLLIVKELLLNSGLKLLLDSRLVSQLLGRGWILGL